ncbi:hypothetical protein Pfo_017772 [Paulownia fortunei]|nr:hypothetical protein Pfo_017772 [Paulownia fortunei]
MASTTGVAEVILPDAKPYPPGYRFVPTDIELILEYLMKKINNEPIPISEISVVNLYQHNPQTLAETHPQLREKEWYFFTPRDRKYRNGSRPSRSAGTGYWKATGADKHVVFENKIVGYRKALVFYEGRPPRGDKTNWIMHEYRVDQTSRPSRRDANDMRLDDWVLCRIYEKAARSNKNQKQDEGSDPVVPNPSEVVAKEDTPAVDNNDNLAAHVVDQDNVVIDEASDELINPFGDCLEPAFQDDLTQVPHSLMDGDCLEPAFQDDLTQVPHSLMDGDCLEPAFQDDLTQVPHSLMEDASLVNFHSQTGFDYGVMNPFDPFRTEFLNEEAWAFQQGNFQEGSLGIENHGTFQQASPYFGPSTSTAFADSFIKGEDSSNDAVTDIPDYNQLEPSKRRRF